jgi:hypothetical protein
MGELRSGVRRAGLLVAVLAAGLAAAQSDADRQAREDLERQLKALVSTPPGRLKLEYAGLFEPPHKLIEATFTVDGKELAAPPLATLNQEGNHALWSGELKPGKHTVAAKLVFENTASPVVSNEGGHKYNVNPSASFPLTDGIEVLMVITPAIDNATKDDKKRFSAKIVDTPRMLSAVDDGKIPEPLAKPKPAEGADAGTAVAALSPAEEKKRKAEEAAAAKKAAAEEKARLAQEALEAKKAAAAEKARLAQEALAAKKAAADEKARLAREAVAAKQSAAHDAAAAKKQAEAEAAEAKRQAVAEANLTDAQKQERAAAAQQAEEAQRLAAADAGAVAAAPAEVDAGAPVAVAPLPKAELAPIRPPPPAPDEGLPWPLILGGGVAVLGVIIFLVSRKKS